MARFSEFRVQRRVLFLLLIIVLGSVLLTARLAYVQLYQNEFFQTKGGGTTPAEDPPGRAAGFDL